MKNPKSYVYFNLHKRVWSCMVRGKVEKHAEFVRLLDTEFVVRPAGHARVIKEQKKNVHAFVKGEDVTDRSFGKDDTYGEPVFISYNPYRGPFFYRKDTGEPVTAAKVVEMYPNRAVKAWGVY